MKSTTLFMLLLFSLRSWSCDHCNVYLGITPNDDKHSIGMYFRSRLMCGSYNLVGQQTLTKHANHGNDPAFWGNQVTENYLTYELRGTFRIKERGKIYVIVPFVQNMQYIDETQRYQLFGLSDPTLIGSFQITDPQKVYKNEKFKQQLEMGFGVKAPLGKVDLLYENERPNLDLQPGTGSWDVLNMLKYRLKIGNFGCSALANYKWNTKNKEGYQYGNTFNGSLNLFYQTKVNNFSFIPVVGASYEQAGYDHSEITHEDTGGHAIFAQIGLQLFLKNFQLFGEFQKAVSNQLNGFTQLINKHKINLGLVYNF